MSETTKYQKLTPNTDIDLKGYDEAFDFVFKNNDVKNIACLLYTSDAADE